MGGTGREMSDEIGSTDPSNVVFSPLDDGTGLEIVDSIERHHYTLYTADSLPSPLSRASEGRFHFPVDAAVRIRTSAITLPNVVAVCVRTATGEPLAEVEHLGHESFPRDEYSIELNAPIKVYLRTESAVTVESTSFRTTIEFGEPAEILVGARSFHERPAGTVTTTDDPRDMMAAISTFGSALKTTSVERSYPTLRGHPPTIELGDKLSIPAGLSPPETGVEVALPADYRSVFVASPLAYYLGATLVPGDRPVLRGDGGLEHPLDTARGFEAEVERVLKQTFFLDCITRTEGYYPVELHERSVIEHLVDLDFARLYGRSLAERLDAYLEVPYSILEPYLPDWKLTSHVEPVPTSIETLPFVVNDLAVIRTPRAREVSGPDVQAAAVDEFLRDDDFTRSTTESAEPPRSFMQPETSGSLEDSWVGSRTPIGASKTTTEAFRNRLGRTPTDGEISITVVCNDSGMDEERSDVHHVYGSRDELPFDVTIREDLTTAELRAELARERDFFHYIGHIDASGFQCTDGALDASTLETVGVDAFFLNACQSYEQGLSLIERGAIGGVVTLSDVINSGAMTIGRVMARLLNCGFPIHAALEVARAESLVGGQYTIVGDGGLAIAQAESISPILCEITAGAIESEFELSMKTFATSNIGMGSLFIPFLDQSSSYYLSSGTIEEFSVTVEELEALFSLENVPVRINGDLSWTDELDLRDVQLSSQGP